MGVVSADTLQLSAVLETVAGQTPATPTFEIWRTTGESLVFAPNTSESGEIGSSGRVTQPDSVTGMTVSGDINFNLSKFTALEQAMAGVMAAIWGECPATGAAGGGIDDNQRLAIAGKDLQTFTIEKRFPNPENVAGTMDHDVTVSGVPGATPQITCTGTAAVGTGAVVMDVQVDNGAIERVTVTIAVGDDNVAVAAKITAALDALSNVSATDAGAGVVDLTTTGSSFTALDIRTGANTYLYQRYKGSTYSVLTVTTSPNSNVTGSVSIIGGVPELDDLPITGVTYTNPADSAIFTSPEVIDLTIGADMTVGTRCWTSLTLSFDSTNRGIGCIGVQGEREVVLGTLATIVSGDLYFSSQDLLEDLLNNETTGDGEFTFSNADGHIYRFDLYGLKPTSGELAAGGTGEDLTIPIEFQPTPVDICSGWNAHGILSLKDTAPVLP